MKLKRHDRQKRKSTYRSLTQTIQTLLKLVKQHFFLFFWYSRPRIFNKNVSLVVDYLRPEPYEPYVYEFNGISSQIQASQGDRPRTLYK